MKAGKNLYLPQFFKENYSLVDLTMKYLNKDSIDQYQTEERTMMSVRLASSRYRVKELLDIMMKDTISSPEKTKQLCSELAAYHNNPAFLKCRSQGEIVKMNMKHMLRKNLALIAKLQSGLED